MTRIRFVSLCACLVILLGLNACTKSYPGIDEVDSQAVSKYIQDNNLSVQQYGQSGIYYQIITQGTGPDIDYSTQIPILYTVKTLDGNYSSLDTIGNRYANFFGYFKPDSLREVIKNALVKQGGSIRIIMPSRFAFGKSGSGSIPGNSSLDFTVTALTANKLPEYEDYVIGEYLQDNNLSGFTKASEGYYYKIIDPGTGVDAITESTTITVEYTGKLLNGTVFDQTATGATATFVLGNTVEGWRLAVPMLKEGGTMQLVIPSSLAYGLNGSGAIPPFNALYFSIKVTDVVN